jgi:hypothetical protein
VFFSATAAARRMRMSKIIELFVWAGYTISLAATILAILLYCKDPYSDKWNTDSGLNRIGLFGYSSGLIYLLCFDVLDWYYIYRANAKIFHYSLSLLALVLASIVFLVPSWRRKVEDWIVFWGKDKK